MAKLKIEYRAAMKAERLGIAFALVELPGSSQPDFYAVDPYANRGAIYLTGKRFDEFDGFVISNFELSESLHAYGIPKSISAKDLLELDEEKIPQQISCTAPTINTTTDPIVYRAQALSIINSFENDDQKTVLSHTLNVRTCTNPVDVATRYFKRHPQCFRCLYYTPQTGLWIVASPELLLDYDSRDAVVRSMSLAGTRKASLQGETWDEKNMLEHDMVTRHIVDVLIDAGFEALTAKQEDLTFNNIVHLCHHIEGRGKVSLSSLIPRLSPTPALCGWPRERAYRQIKSVEAHVRGCYGGFVGVKSPEKALIYVNLRCAKVMADYYDDLQSRIYDYTIFGGGGLTRRSDPASEWAEAKLKIRSLRDSL